MSGCGDVRLIWWITNKVLLDDCCKKRHVASLLPSIPQHVLYDIVKTEVLNTQYIFVCNDSLRVLGLRYRRTV